jgi:lysyl-tRNA synthetase class 2
VEARHAFGRVAWRAAGVPVRADAVAGPRASGVPARRASGVRGRRASGIRGWRAAGVAPAMSGADEAWRPGRLAARLPALRERARLAAATRAWFAAGGYLEVETPCLVPVPGAEVHLMGFAAEWDPFPMAGETRRLWLRTSPEFALKRLLAGGVGPVFELARVWRNGEAGDRHAPEFTMLEWYRPGLSLSGLMDEAEGYIAAMLAGTPAAPRGPFLRLTMEQAFARFAGCDLLASIGADGTGDAATLARAAGEALREGEAWEDLFFRLLLDRVEPALPCDQGVFLSHWPAPQAALARRDPDDPRVALRVEAFLGGLELANGFEELTDAAEQRARFTADAAERARRYPGREWPLDEGLLAALPLLPACSGIALGFDRLAMLATGAARIADVLWLPPDPPG